MKTFENYLDFAKKHNFTIENLFCNESFSLTLFSQDNVNRNEILVDAPKFFDVSHNDVELHTIASTHYLLSIEF